MRLAPKDDPGGDKAGSVPLSVFLAVLQENDVQVTKMDAGMYKLKSDMRDSRIVEAHRFTDPVNGRMVRRMAKKFAVYIMDFYYDPATSEPRFVRPC